ncbi:MAG TPA: GNAT family N-acetyltransferase [Verrucomicrobiae bacterium]|jgi:hypothetical protein|nr:GNAT family N-acetyltransferase [Verrucomicrobiae bacterium]
MNAKILNPAAVDWARLDAFADRTVFQTREWLNFVHETQRAEIVVCELSESGQTVGYFSGLVFTRIGVRVLGSSFPGWTTPYMGFNLLLGASRKAALAAIERMAWDTLKCLHMEVSDPYFAVDDGAENGFATGEYFSYRTDLTESEDKIFGKMSSACRRCVRKAEKSGVTLEQAHDLAFADEYYEQLKDVFAKQGLVPTYSVERVRALIGNLDPTGRLLLVRARDSEGNCIATGIFPGFNKICEFWGNASFRSSQILRPNEAIHWYAMRYWKNRGVEIYDWGGGSTYKEKYGCVPHPVPWFTKSRYRVISTLRGQAKAMIEKKQRFQGWLQGRRRKEEQAEEAESS